MQQDKYPLRVIFCKKLAMRFISHLDLMRLFMRALRRAGLPIFITQGFSPHPKISTKGALKLGLESESQEAIFFLTEKCNEADFTHRLNRELPDGIKIREANYAV